MKHLILMVVMFASFTLAQEHAPTKAQCDADARLWSVDSNDIDGWQRLEQGPLPYQELQNRALYMRRCAKAYAGSAEDKAYWDVENMYDMLIGGRVQNFVMRHKLWEQFVDEDTAGMR